MSTGIVRLPRPARSTVDPAQTIDDARAATPHPLVSQSRSDLPLPTAVVYCEGNFGAPDGIVVNVTTDQIWVREGILPDFPNQRAPQQDFTNGQLVVPMPPTDRTKIQEPFVREQQIDPDKYYPKGYKPQLLEEWPADADIVAPVEALPENLR